MLLRLNHWNNSDEIWHKDKLELRKWQRLLFIPKNTTPVTMRFRKIAVKLALRARYELSTNYTGIYYIYLIEKLKHMLDCLNLLLVLVPKEYI